MEILGIINVPEWIIVGLIAIYLLHLYFSWNYGTLEAMGVKCPKPKPFFGNYLSEFFSVIHEMDVEFNKKYGRVHGFYESKRPTLKISDPELLKEIMVKQFNNFPYRRYLNVQDGDPVVRLITSTLRGDHWKRTRTILTPTFTIAKLKQMTFLVEKCCLRLMETLEEKSTRGETIEAKSLYTPYLLEIIGSCAFGIDVNSSYTKGNDIFKKNALKLTFTRKFFSFFLLMTFPGRLLKYFHVSVLDTGALDYSKKVLKAVMDMRMSGKERRNDFLQTIVDMLRQTESVGEMAQTEKQDIKDAFTHDGITALCILFLVAGFETTTINLSFITYLAATHPECQEKLIEEVDTVLEENNNEVNYETILKMKYMDKFINEALRLYPPVIRINRECAQDAQVGNLKIPKGMLINIPIYAIHHDEEFYKDPYEFDPERFSPENQDKRNTFTYLPFGTGLRNCIGLKFAEVEVKLTLAHILQRFRFRLAPEAKEPLVFKKGTSRLLPVNGIQIRLEKRL